MKPRRLPPLRRLLAVLAAATAGLALVVAPAGAQAASPRAVFSAAAAKPAPISVNVAGAPIRCDVSYGNDVTVFRRLPQRDLGGRLPVDR